MILFGTLFHRLHIALAELRWSALIAMAILHMLVCWLLFRLAAEATLTDGVVTFLYYYITTATTVGYGDLSPKTDFGRLVAAFVALPGGIAVFSAVLGKAVGGVGGFWRRRMNGLGDYSDRTGHLVVIGWQEGRTRRIVELLGAEKAAGEPLTVLVAKGLPTNPLPEMAHYVRAERLAEAAALMRAGLAGAKSVLVCGGDDDETLAAALAAASMATGAHIVANFDDPQAGDLIRQLHPAVEMIGPLSSEIMARATRHPGSSAIASLLFSAGTCDAVYSLVVPSMARSLSFSEAFFGLKTLHNVTVVGMRRDGKVDLNCEGTAAIREGQILYYISDRRLDSAALSWSRLGEVAR